MSEFLELSSLPSRSSASLRSTTATPRLTKPSYPPSENVKRLQDCLNLVFSSKERAVIVQLLSEYHTDRDVNVLVDSLAPMLDSAVKQHFLSLLCRVLPPKDVSTFEEACAERRLVTLGRRRNKSSEAGTESRETVVPRSASFSPGTQNSFPSARTVCLAASRSSASSKAELGRQLGLTLRTATRDGKSGLYVTKVATRSPAEEGSLYAGDRLLRIQKTSCDGWSIDRAYEAIGAAVWKYKRVRVEVVFEGYLPQRSVAQFSFCWTDVHGRPCSPPPGFDVPDDLVSEDEETVDGSPTHSRKRARRSTARHLPANINSDRKVHLQVSRSKPLGISIRGGREFALGVFITGVDPFSPAEAAGLRPGDQVLDVNDVDFLDIPIADASRLFKSSSHLVLTVRSVGKIPYARNLLDRTTWRRIRPPNQPRATEAPQLHRGPGSQLTWSSMALPNALPPRQRVPLPMETITASEATSEEASPVEGKALKSAADPLEVNDAERRFKRLAAVSLSESELLTLSYYVREYRSGHVTVDQLVLALSQLLLDESQRALFPLIRDSAVRVPERDRFDVLVLADEMRACADDDDSAMNLSREASTLNSEADQSEFGPRTTRCLEQAMEALDSLDVRPREYRSSADSGIAVPGFVEPVPESGEEKEDEEEKEENVAEIESDAWLSPEVEERNIECNEEPEEEWCTVVLRKTQPTLGMAIEGGANTKLPLPRIINIQVPSGSQLVLAAQALPDRDVPGIPENSGLLVRVQTFGTNPKLRRLRRLGLSIVGGADVPKYPLPRIVEVEPGGSAHESGGLNIGQIIHEVNGTSLLGFSHRDAARLIAEAFRRTDRDFMELKVTNA